MVKHLCTLQHENGFMHIISPMLQSEKRRLFRPLWLLLAATHTKTTCSRLLTALRSEAHHNPLLISHQERTRSPSLGEQILCLGAEEPHAYYLNTIWAVLTRREKAYKTTLYLSPKLILTPCSLWLFWPSNSLCLPFCPVYSHSCSISAGVAGVGYIWLLKCQWRAPGFIPITRAANDIHKRL